MSRRIAKVQADGSMKDYATYGEDYTNLGQIEMGDNASYQHAVGTTFIWKGQFVKTTTAIEPTQAISGKVSPTTVSEILSELNSKIETTIVATVTADGTKTYAQLLSTLYNDINNFLNGDKTLKPSRLSIIDIANSETSIYRLEVFNSNSIYVFQYVQSTDSSIYYMNIAIKASNSERFTSEQKTSGITFNNTSSGVPLSGRKFVVVYE